MHPCINFFQMKPTRCTRLLSIFISTSPHVSRNCVPTIRRAYCIYATLVFFSLYGWMSGLHLLMIGTQLRETCGEVEINILRNRVHLVGFIWKIVSVFSDLKLRSWLSTQHRPIRNTPTHTIQYEFHTKFNFLTYPASRNFQMSVVLFTSKMVCVFTYLQD